jgi:hypothetical protein
MRVTNDRIVDRKHGPEATTARNVSKMNRGGPLERDRSGRDQGLRAGQEAFPKLEILR